MNVDEERTTRDPGSQPSVSPTAEPRPIAVAPHTGRMAHHSLKEIQMATGTVPPQPQPAPVEEKSDEYTLSVVIPAYNEGDSVDRVIYKIRELRPLAEIIVVDDGSRDDTADAARRAGARVIRHPYNKGNGAAVKTGLRAARGDVVLLLDADGQHPPEDIKRVLAPIGEYDLVVGARTRQSQSAFIRDVGNSIFNSLASYLAGRSIPDLTSGFRAMKRDMIMEFIHLLPNLYSYPTTSTLAFLKAGYNVEFVPIVARKGTGRSNTKIFRDGTRAIVIILRIITLFAPMKIFLPLSIILFLGGVVYGLANIFLAGISRIPNGSVLLILSSLFIFLFGLISEQIAAMRFESSQRPRATGDGPWSIEDGRTNTGKDQK